MSDPVKTLLYEQFVEYMIEIDPKTRIQWELWCEAVRDVMDELVGDADG